MSRHKVILALVFVIIVCGAAACLWQYDAVLGGLDVPVQVTGTVDDPSATVDTARASVEDAAHTESSARTARPTPSDQQVFKSQDVLENTIVALSSTDDDKWITGAQKLAQMEPSDQWRVLSAPGVADQAVSKALRKDIATRCASSLRAIQMRNRLGARDDDESGRREKTAVNEWCKHLLATHSVDYYMEQARELAQSTNLLASEVFVPAFENDELSGSEHSNLDEFLIERLQTAGNSVEIKQLVLRLWGLHSSLFVNEWPRVATMSGFQQGRMQVALATSVACRATYSCGPMSVSTIGFCAVMPGMHCNPGQSLDTALIANLSVYEYHLLQDMARRALAVRGM